MIIDCHVHVESGIHVHPEKLLKKLEGSRMDELVVLSLSPSYYKLWKERDYSNQERLDNLMAWCEGSDKLHPVYWIDPTEEDAEKQVVEAVERGVEGFKVICSHFYPGDPRAKKVYRRIAEMNRSILFHSGILWDGLPSSKYNRPAEFEELIDIVGLKFALAHISWPWTDECIALFGKYQNAYETNGLDTARMYIDLTPGTPPIYREEALYRVFKTGYNIEKNIIFGTDNVMHTYDVALSDEYLDRDLEIYRKLGLSDQVVEDVLKNNVREFFGFQSK